MTTIPSTKGRYTTAIWMSAVCLYRQQQILILFFTVNITWLNNNFSLASSIYSGIWHTCTNGVNNGCRKSAYGQEILPPIMSGKVTTHAAITYGRVNVRARVPKGAFLWPGLFYEEKNRCKTKIFELHGFFLWNISPFYFPLAIWLLPRDNHYGNWPRSGEIDLMETKGMDIVLAFFFHLFF